jgi:hypothetical protein
MTPVPGAAGQLTRELLDDTRPRAGNHPMPCGYCTKQVH